MSNEIIAVLLTAFYILSSKKLDLCAAIILYYCACILTGSYTIGYRIDESPQMFYLQQALIDLAAIVFICYLSQFHKKAVFIYALYAAIICLPMTLNGLMLIDQQANAHVVTEWHLLYQEYAQLIDVVFAVIGSANVSRYIVRFLPFGGR